MSSDPQIEPELVVVGWVRSALQALDQAPRQGDEGAPEATIEILEPYSRALEGLAPGDDIVVLTWLHRASRDTLQTHPRGDLSRAVLGVFATRSPARPNPIGLHTTRIVAASETTLRVAAFEAIDGTPVLDIKPVLGAKSKR